MSSLQRLGVPRPVRAELGATREPVRVDGRRVEAVRGRWIVEEGWWTDRPVRRRDQSLTPGAQAAISPVPWAGEIS